MARNYWQLVHPERIVVLSLVVTFAAVVVAYLLTRAGVRRSTAVFTVFIATIMFMRGGQLLWQFDGVFGWLVVLSPVILAAILAARLGDHPAIRVAAVGLAVALASGPPISLYVSLQEAGPDRVLDPPTVEVRLVEKPNVFFVVLDGYPGLQALEQDFGLTKIELMAELHQRGFQVPTSVWSPYWSTELAVPSMLQMDYPVEEGPRNTTTRRGLHQVIAGDNHLMRILRDNGYRTVMVEAGWTGSSCGSAFDTCVSSPWLDDLVFAVLWEGLVARSLVASRGHAYTVSTQATMDWLRTNAADLTDDETPTFVFAHLIAPHPPLFLDSSCETIVTDERIGGFSRQDVDRATREGFFFDQMECVDGFMNDLADRVDPSDVLIFVADHGTEHRQLVNTPGETWNHDGIIERMNVFAAVRARSDCELGDSLVTPNLIRRVLSCYSTSTLEDLPNRIFLPGMFELAPEEVEELLAWRPGLP